MVTPYINDEVANDKDKNTALTDFYKILLYLDNSELKRLFGEIYNQNIVNIKPEMKDLNNMYKINNNMNNNIGIKMNMNMNINNFNINTTMNPLGQNNNMFPNMNNLGMNPMGINLQQQYLQQINKNINLKNAQAAYLLKLAQAQNMMKNGGNGEKW